MSVAFSQTMASLNQERNKRRILLLFATVLLLSLWFAWFMWAKIPEYAQSQQGQVVGMVGDGSDDARLYFKARFPVATVLPKMAQGQTAQIQLAGFRQANHARINGEVHQIGSELVSNAIEVVFKLNPETNGVPLMEGMPGQARVAVGYNTPYQWLLIALGKRVKSPNGAIE